MAWGKKPTKRAKIARLPKDKASKEPTTVVRIPIASIRPDDFNRELDETHVEKLVQQLKRMGQLDPIKVRERGSVYWEYDGQHRVEAAKRLKHTEIDAIILKGTRTDALLAQWMADDNLKHSALVRADRLVRLVKLVTRDMNQSRQTSRGRPEEKVAKAARFLPLGGTQKARVKRIQRAFLIAELPAKVKAKAKEVGLDAKQSVLLEIAGESSSAAQLKLLEEYARRQQKQRSLRANKATKKRRTVNVADTGEGCDAEVGNADASFEALKRACPQAFLKIWQKADMDDRRRFVTEVLKWAGAGQDDEEDW